MSQVPSLDNTFGAMFVGVIVASVLYGVSCSQGFYYFQHYSHEDGLTTKAVVIATLLSDTVHQALISHSIYTYVITGYFTPTQLGEIVEVIFTGLTALFVQTFFAVRIWKFSHKNILVTAILAAFILGEFVSVITYVAKTFHITTFEQLPTLKPLSMSINVLAVAGDVSITTVSCFLLHRARNNLRRSDTIINLLIIFSVETGMLTSLCAIASFISITISPHTFIYISFYFLLGRLYCNSLLAALNIRKAIRGTGHGDNGISLGPILDPHTSTTSKKISTKSKAVGYIPDVEAGGYRGNTDANDHNQRPPLVRPVSKDGPVESESDLKFSEPGCGKG